MAVQVLTPRLGGAAAPVGPLPLADLHSPSAYRAAAQVVPAAVAPPCPCRTAPAKLRVTTGPRVVLPRPNAAHSSDRRPRHRRCSPEPPCPVPPALAAHWPDWDTADRSQGAAVAAWRSRHLPGHATS